MRDTVKYSDYVDYGRLNPFKRLALRLFAPTFSHPERLGIRVVEETLGEPAVAFDFQGYDFMLAFNVEGLGTKSLIADEMYAKMRVAEAVGGARLFRGLGVDNVAMSVNDLIAVGAEPFAYGDIISTGDSGYLDDEARMESLLAGLRDGVDQAGAALPLGETPTLVDVINPGTVDLAGASVGLIKPKTRLVHGGRIMEGDAILGMESSGIHSNGVTLARKIVEASPGGYFTEAPGGSTVGEELLTPTRIYAKPLAELHRRGVEVHYLAPVTGGALRKLMRARKPYAYRITELPPVPRIFETLRSMAEEAGTPVTDHEAYQTWNMGLGYAVFTPPELAEEAITACRRAGVACTRIGAVEKGDKKVIVEPKNLVYSD